MLHRIPILSAVAALLAIFTSSLPAQSAHVLHIENASTSLGGVVSMPVLFDAVGSDVIGWSYGVCHDSALATLVSISSGSTTQTCKQGNAADFESLEIEPGGFTQGVIVCFTFCDVLTEAAGYQLAVPSYQSITLSDFDVSFCGTLSLPTVDVLIVEPPNLEIVPQTLGATVSVGGASGDFRRGDGNLDGVVNLADVISTLSFLFQGTSEPGCYDASDTNDDGTVDLSDVIFTISYLFTQGDEPPAPGLNCGPDATSSDSLDCVSATGC